MGPLSQPHPAAGALLWGCARRGAVALTGLPGGVRGPGTVPGTLEHCRDTSASLGSAAGTTGSPNCLQERVLRPGVRFGGYVGSPALPREGPWQGEGQCPGTGVTPGSAPDTHTLSQTAGAQRGGLSHAISDDQR